MSESYKGFVIECERTDAASFHTWCVVGIDGHIYQCSGKEYVCSGEAEDAAEQWIDYYIKSLPNTDTVKTSLRIQSKLKEIEEELQKLTKSPYTGHYKRIEAEEANIVKYLDEAIENVTEALKINEQTIRKMHRENG
jgi:LPS O-antigen subunit length determinant protein (WzzB/FepE family)